MTSKSKNLKKAVPSKSVPLGHVLNQSEKVKKTVKQAASELASVNKVLKQEKQVDIPVQTIKEAITQNEDVERKVAKAADDLKQVNTNLAKEVAERVVIESELADTKTDLADTKTDLAEAKTDLAEALDDLSKSQAKEEEAIEIALHDALTGLPNRVLFEQRLDYGLRQSKRHGWGFAVLFIDIDKFKSINDDYGHDLGDKVLLMVANRLKSFIRQEDTVSRWGGDEFVCLLLEIKQEADVTRFAERMANRIAEACGFNGIDMSISVSIGIAIYPAHGETADILFKNADTAMYQAKGAENRVLLFRE
jgi:diguanylate cyclase (GGDEF)-like protein